MDFIDVDSAELAFHLNLYEDFIRRHLKHYGYFCGKEKPPDRRFKKWEKSQESPASDSSNSDSDTKDKDLKTQEDALKTTQLVYSYQAGKMVPKLREPRQLYGFNSSDMGPQQLARWPAELQVIDERIKHILYVPEVPEPFYKTTGMEKMPTCRSGSGEGRTVYHYEPLGTFFLRSRVGGNRGGCGQVGVTLEDSEDKTLLFESRFESGNLAKAVQISSYEYELWLRNDLYTNKHTQWYYFQIKNTRPNITYRFTIVNLMKPDSLYNHGMRPLMYSERNAEENGIGWVRAGSSIKYYRNNVKYMLGKTEKCYYSLTWTVQFRFDQDTVYFAHCYPYTYSDLQDYISDIAQDPIKSKICKQRVMCRSLAGNMVYVLNITAPSKNGEDNKNKKAVIITSRVHPGESNASWMMKGFLDYLLGNSPDARLLRDTFIFKVVPMLNPDGVIVGNYRCSLAGRDLNRNYKSVLKESFPTIYHTRLMIHRVLEEREVAVYCDLHGHSRKQNVFIYGCENRGNPHRRLRERVFPMMLSRNTPDKFIYDCCKFKIQKSKEGTGRIVMWNMGIMNSYTMEATFAGSTVGKRKGTHFHTGDLEAMGYHFCDTLLDYCDPDPTKMSKIMFELEEKLRMDILQHLKQREGAEISGDMDINLDEDLSSELESSDGGSDSSNSDGLPVHLQYMAERKLTKKKKLKTRKERDKHKCQGHSERKLALTPAATQTSDSDKKEKPSAGKGQGSKQSRKPSDGRSSGGQPVYSQERAEFREAKKAHIYLDTLTNAYLKNGLLPTENNRAVPHFRYSGPQDSSTIHLETMCPHHEKTFTSQFMSSQMHNMGYPDYYTVQGQEHRRTDSEVPLVRKLSITLDRKMQDSAVARILSLSNTQGQRLPVRLSLRKFKYFNHPHAQSDDGDEVPPHFDGRPKSGLIKKPETAKSRQKLSPEKRQFSNPTLSVTNQQLANMETGKHGELEDYPSASASVKQHPPPFDMALEREKPLDIRASSSHGRRSRMDSAGPSGMTTRLPPSTEDQGLEEEIRGDHQPPFYPQVQGSSGHMATSKRQSSRPTSGRLSRHGGDTTVRGKQHASQPSFSDTPYVPTTRNDLQSLHQSPKQHSTVHSEYRSHLQSLKSQSSKSQSSTQNEPQSLEQATSSSSLPAQRQVYQKDGAMTYRRPSPMSASSQGTPRQLAQTRRSISQSCLQANPSNPSLNNDAMTKRPLNVSNDNKPVGRAHLPKNASTEITDTIRSIQQIKESLLDPASRTNISPTTGQFIDHFIRKTDQEINAITAGLPPNTMYQNFEEEECSSDASRRQIAGPAMQQYYSSYCRPATESMGAKSVVNSDAPVPQYSSTPNFQSNNSNSVVNSANSHPAVRETDRPDGINEVNAAKGTVEPMESQGFQLSQRQRTSYRPIPQTPLTESRPTMQLSLIKRQSSSKNLNDLQSISMINMDNLLGDVQSASQKLQNKRRNQRYEEEFVEDKELASAKPASRMSSSQSQSKKQVSKPAKISLMIGQHRQDEQDAPSSHLQPLTRVIRTPSVRPLRRY